MDAPAPSTKRCKDCGDEKAITQYAQKKDGRANPYCRACASLRTKAWNKANPEKYRSNVKRWREKHPLRVRELNGLSQRRHREERNAWHRANHQKNRPARNRQSREWNQRHPGYSTEGTRRRRLLLKFRSEPELLLDHVESLLPSYMFGDIKEELKQNVVLAILSGEMKPEDRNIKAQIKKSYLVLSNTKSLDAPITAEGLRLSDVLEG